MTYSAVELKKYGIKKPTEYFVVQLQIRKYSKQNSFLIWQNFLCN